MNGLEETAAIACAAAALVLLQIPWWRWLDGQWAGINRQNAIDDAARGSGNDR